MPRLIHRLPKYRKHRASGQAVVTLNGRDHYLCHHGTKSSKEQYDRLCGEYLSSGGTLLQDKRDEVSIVVLLRRLCHARKDLLRARQLRAAKLQSPH